MSSRKNSIYHFRRPPTPCFEEKAPNVAPSLLRTGVSASDGGNIAVALRPSPCAIAGLATTTQAMDELARMRESIPKEGDWYSQLFAELFAEFFP